MSVERGALVVGFGLLLAGCQSTPVQQMSYTETKALAQELHARCAAEGAPQGSPEFDACMKQELTRETSIRNARAERRRHMMICRPVFNTVMCN